MDDKSNLRIQKEILYRELTANQKFDPEHYPTPYEPGLQECSGWVDTQNPGIEGNGNGERQVIQYHDKAGHFWASLRFYGLVIVFGGGALFSFLCLIGSVLIGPR